jgi:hypothetical protein
MLKSAQQALSNVAIRGFGLFMCRSYAGSE